MQDTFDPYYKWLGIPAEQQPPTLYRLLGTNDFERDIEAINAAADSRMGFLRGLQTGPHANLAVQLLNEVARARVILSNPSRRAAYDCVLQSAKPADAEAADPAVTEPSKPTPAAPERSTEDRVFGNYQILEPIYSSRLGDVYKAVHRPSGRLISLKVLPANLASQHEPIARFRREQEITCKLTHRNLIPGYDAGEYKGIPYLVTEYVVGADLATLVRQHGPLPVEQAVDYTTQAARGLVQLHLNGVYHRNVKPQILWIDMRGEVKVTNLFLAKLSETASVGGDDDDLTQMGQIMGTAEYLAPEQAMNAKAADGRADIYSLGCTLHFLLTGSPPYPGKSLMDKLAAHRTQPIPTLRVLRDDVPEHVDAAFQRMMAKDPAVRFQVMTEVVEALEPPKTKGFWQRLTAGLGKLLGR